MLLFVLCGQREVWVSYNSWCTPPAQGVLMWLWQLTLRQLWVDPLQKQRWLESDLTKEESLPAV